MSSDDKTDKGGSGLIVDPDELQRVLDEEGASVRGFQGKRSTTDRLLPIVEKIAKAVRRVMEENRSAIDPEADENVAFFVGTSIRKGPKGELGFRAITGLMVPREDADDPLESMRSQVGGDEVTYH